MLRLLSVICLTVCALQFTGKAQQTLPSIEAYGNLPAISGIALSPNGQRLAFIQRSDDFNVLRVIDLEDVDYSYAANIGEAKAGGIAWAGNGHVILRSSKTTRIYGYRGKIDYSGAFAVNIETEKIQQLLTKTDELYPGQSGLGSIVGYVEGTNKVLMLAYMGHYTNRNPSLNLLKVDLNTGKGRVHSNGNGDTVDWFADTDGTILAREDYSNRTNKYKLSTKQSGKWETVLEYETENGPRGLVGGTPDKSALVVFGTGKDGFSKLRLLSFDGTYSEPQMAREKTEINCVLVDENRVVLGVVYGGLQPSYDFFDKDLARDVQDMQDKEPSASVRLESWSENFKKLIFYIEGAGYAGGYFILDRSTSDLKIIASARPDIPQEAIGDVLTIEYNASDGLKIPGVMTVPKGSDIKGLPAIIMPHGGPESHDQVSFHWMAQYFASRGYLVFQPNFRGSDGLGAAFTEAGYGGWGGVMQQDITDGVAALTKGGMIDPDRACIVGWSYGGYAALAGGAFTPEHLQMRCCNCPGLRPTKNVV